MSFPPNVFFSIFLIAIFSSPVLPVICYQSCETKSTCKADANTSTCYRSNEVIGCADAQTICDFTHASCENSPPDKTCCCDSDQCNAKCTDTDDGWFLWWFKWVVVAIIALALLAFGIIMARKYRQKLFRKRTAQEEQTQSSAKSFRDFCSMDEGEGGFPEVDADAEFINNTHVKILPTIKAKDIKELEKQSKSPPPLPVSTSLDSEPLIVRVVTYSTCDTITIVEEDPSHSLKSQRSPPYTTDFRQLAIQMLKYGPRQYPLRAEQIASVLSKATKLFIEEPSLIEVPIPCIVYGDIHGQYSDLLRWLNLNGFPNRVRCVFLGDFVDRGAHGVEVVVLITCLKLMFPHSVYVIRGNHEEEVLNKAYSFFDEVKYRFPVRSDEKPTYEYFKQLFMMMPLAVLIGKKVLGMHGGISPKLTSLQDIRDIERPIDEFEVGTLACDLVWSDPDPSRIEGFRSNTDREPTVGIGQLFAEDAVVEACEQLGVSMMIRGHQAPLHGYALFARHKMLTLFSAPGYKGRTAVNTNMGACLYIDEHFEITIKQIQVTEEYRALRIDDFEKRRLKVRKDNAPASV